MTLLGSAKFNIYYIVNFYNKLDQLGFLKSSSITNSNNKYPAKVTRDDLAEAVGKLRFEVQAHYRYLSKINDKYANKDLKRPLRSFLDPDISLNVILDKYRWFIGDPDCDFYSYTEARKIVDASTLPSTTKKALQCYLLKVSRNYNITQENHSRNSKKLKELNIHWFLIPTSWKIDYLKSPANLLLEEVMKIKEEHSLEVITGLLSEAGLSDNQITTVNGKTKDASSEDDGGYSSFLEAVNEVIGEPVYTA